MRGKFVIIGLAIALSGVAVNAQDQTKVTTPIPNDLYCSGVYTNHAPPRDTFIITGEESESKVTFQEGNYIYLNKGESQGVHVGDMFSVVRAVDDPTREPWFDQQFKLMHAIGTLWQDEGH